MLHPTLASRCRCNRRPWPPSLSLGRYGRITIAVEFVSPLNGSGDLPVNAMMNDLELLRNYATEGVDDAFRTVLERHAHLQIRARRPVLVT
jgi:hypothetical protein